MVREVGPERTSVPNWKGPMREPRGSTSPCLHQTDGKLRLFFFFPSEVAEFTGQPSALSPPNCLSSSIFSSPGTEVELG